MTFWTLYDRIEWAIGLLMLTATVVTVFVAAVGRTLGMPVQSARSSRISSCSGPACSEPTSP